MILNQDETFKKAQKEKEQKMKVKEKELQKFRLQQMGAGYYDSLQI